MKKHDALNEKDINLVEVEVSYKFYLGVAMNQDQEKKISSEAKNTFYSAKDNKLNFFEKAAKLHVMKIFDHASIKKQISEKNISNEELYIFDRTVLVTPSGANHSYGKVLIKVESVA
jgi:hypothetical protein